MTDERLRQAAAYLKAHRRAEARHLARAILAEDESSATAWAILAQAAVDQQEAMKCLRRARALTRDERVRRWAEEQIDHLEVETVRAATSRSTLDGALTGLAAVLGVLVVALGGALALTGAVRPTPVPALAIPSTAAATPSIGPGGMTLTARALRPIPTVTDTPTPTKTPTPRPTITWAPSRTPLPPPTATPVPTAGPPGSVRLVSPALDAIINRASTVFQWSAQGEIDSYRLTVQRLGGAEVFNQTYGPDICGGEACMVSIPGSVLGNGSYVWQVEAANELGAAVGGPLVFTRAYAELDSFALGGQVPHSFAHASLMQASGMTWIKLQVTWPDMPASTAGAFVRNGHALGFKVLLSVKGPLYPESIDFAAYPDYLRQVAAYQPDAIEVWNEMNLYTEWPAGQINPASYVNDMLAPAYRAVKLISPNTIVITGALASTGVNDGVEVWADDRYVQGMMRAGAARYADCLGFHYNAGATSPHATAGHPADPGEGHYSWYFGPTVDMYRRAVGGALPLCLTEMGFLSGEGYPPLPEDWFWAGGTTAEKQAAWLAEAVAFAREMGLIRLVIVWNVDFTTWEEDGDPQAGFAIVRPDGSCPACAALRDVMVSE